MSIILFLIVVVVIIALLVWAIDFASLPAPAGNLLKLLVIVLGVIAIAQRAGLV